MSSSTELDNVKITTSETDDGQSTGDGHLVDEEQITINYLRNHSDFFDKQPDLLTTLDVPHETGNAISLIERQVNVLREQNSQQKIHLAELVEIAKDNELSNQRIHKLTLSLLACNAIDACEVALDESLCRDFSVDAIALKLFTDPIEEQPEHLFVADKDPLKLELDKLLTTRKPVCGFFKNLPMNMLFDEKAETISSLAVLPLYIEKNDCFGVLVMGSNNIRRFDANMGTLFLERLAEIISHIVKPMLK